MREGFDADDIYIMVEDEFQSIAQSFTQHLHHAEYIRMRNKAKTENASAIKDLARPTDASTTMRAETKKRKEAEVLSAKHKAALKQIKADAGVGIVTPGEEDDEMEEDKEDDPWVGTTLQGLMTSPKKSQQALVGLQGVKSTTRAAAGFSKAVTPSPKKQNSIFDLSIPAPIHNGTTDQPVEVENEVTSDDDDDLDALPKEKVTVAMKGKNSFAKYAAPKTGNTSKANAESSSKIATSTSSFKSVLRKPFDDFDDLYELPPPQRTVNGTSSTKVVRKDYHGSKRAREEQEAKLRKSKLSEIPTFLV